MVEQPWKEQAVCGSETLGNPGFAGAKDLQRSRYSASMIGPCGGSISKEIEARDENSERKRRKVRQKVQQKIGSFLSRYK
jgi:hypothetical protein